MSQVLIPKNEIHIELHIPDFNIAETFYSKLGFKKVWRKDSNNGDGYMVVQRDNSIIGFYGGNNQVYNHQYFSKFDSNTPRGYGVEIAIFISDIDIQDYYDMVKNNIDSKYIVEELKLHEYNKRDFRIIDPFGYYLRFSEPENNLYEN